MTLYLYFIYFFWGGGYCFSLLKYFLPIKKSREIGKKKDFRDIFLLLYEKKSVNMSLYVQLLGR